MLTFLGEQARERSRIVQYRTILVIMDTELERIMRVKAIKMKASVSWQSLSLSS